MSKVTYLLTVRVKRATVEFAPGLGVGVLATQEVTFNVPAAGREWLLEAGLSEQKMDMLNDVIEVTAEEIK